MKTSKRNRKKIERRRKSRARSNQSCRDVLNTLATGAAIAAGTHAYAAPVSFENPAGAGHFTWGDSVLDVTLDAGNQPGMNGGPASFEQIIDEYYRVYCPSGGAVESTIGPYEYLFAIGLNAGQVIPSGAPWATNYGITYYDGYTYIPEGTASYLGVRFDPGDGTRYGWIGVVRTGTELDAFAWGYESIPGQPIEAGARACDVQGDPTGDCDGDGVQNSQDNCPDDSNPSQADFDGDGLGDVCDPDIDGDGVGNTADVCDDTPSGVTVDVDGASKGDINGDCKLDAGDIQAFVNGYITGGA
ncbi:MAG: thrombospondin type 3 repeat-containing protein [Phycisphaerales bacterium]|nr:thrombospondin type 3 repeat-containing protein [Phycisphaerales bacterium]